MKTLLFALLQIVLATGILYSYYHFFLRNKKFHQYNRFYLLAATIISVAIPFINIPVYFDTADTPSFVLQTLTDFSYGAPEETSSVLTPLNDAGESWFTWQNILSTVYISIAALLLLRVLISLLKIRSLIKNNPVSRTTELNFVNTNAPGTPFSFFRWLFWDRNIDIESVKGEQVFRHELFHIREKHSADVLFLEIITLIFWINPFFHLIRKEIKAIHEFLADQHASEGNNKWEYAELLLMQVLKTKQSLVNPFFHNQIKRRIAMITTSQKTSYQYLRKMLVLPVAAMVIGLFAFNYKNRNEEPVIALKDQLTIVLDAGHGGIDPGIRTRDEKYTEATISLQIAKAVQTLAPEYNVKIVMTREDDKLPGAAVSVDEGLKQRVKISNEANADAFLSIHINGEATPLKNNSGIEAYISNTKQDNKAKILAAAILDELGSVYKTDTKIKTRKEQHIYVLDKTSVPSVLLQCGMMTNPDDLAFITDPKNQEKIARKILEGLVKYAGTAVTTIENSVPGIHDTVPASVKSKLNTDVYEKVEIDAMFPGGKDKWEQFLKRNLDVEIAAKNNAPAKLYTIYLQFIVNKDGSIRDIQPLTNHGYGMEQEAIRLIKKGPYWSPALVNGQPVNAYVKQRIDFKGLGITTAGSSTRTLNEVVLVAYIPSGPIKKTPPETISSSLPPVQGNSPEWRKFLERNVSATVAVNDGWKEGSYPLLIQFTKNENGSISDIKALNYVNSDIARHSIAVIKNIQGMLPGAISTANTKEYYIQPLTISLEELNRPGPITKVTLNNSKLPRQPAVLYVGIDNPLEVSNSALKTENMKGVISQGTISIRDNKLVVRVNTPGKVLVKLFNKDNNEVLGEFGFDALLLPEPTLVAIK